MYYDDDDIEAAELRQEMQAKRRYMQRLLAHPDPRDPDHPGDEGEGE